MISFALGAGTAAACIWFGFFLGNRKEPKPGETQDQRYYVPRPPSSPTDYLETTPEEDTIPAIAVPKKDLQGGAIKRKAPEDKNVQERKEEKARITDLIA